MEHGVHCQLADCNRLDFLPVPCPLCKTSFCFEHHLPKAHSCTAPGASAFEEETFVDPAARKAASTTARTPCPVAGCKRLTLQVEELAPSSSAAGSRPPKSTTAATGPGQAEQAKVFTHAAPRCYRCHGLFCPEHRTPAKHGCTAPAPKTEGQLRADAADERKRKAQELLSKHFPSKGKKP